MSHKYSLDELKSLSEKIRYGLNDWTLSETKIIFTQIEEVINGFKTYKSSEDLEIIRKIISTLAANPTCHKFARHLDPAIFKQFGQTILSTNAFGLIPEYLDIFRSSYFLKKIYDDSEWPGLILRLLNAGNYTFPVLFSHRSRKYKNKVLFTVLEHGKSIDFSWLKISRMVKSYARGLFVLLGGAKSASKVAFFTNNSLDMVLFDLACLTHGIVNVMIPANSVPEHIDYILNITKPATLIISDKHLYEKVNSIIAGKEFIKSIVMLDDKAVCGKNCYKKDDVIAIGNQIRAEEMEMRQKKIELKDLATIMFTSGTTGNPKGIQFSHQNIIFKRFARAMALPELGENDLFLAYLPLFHTFGRWFEMTGSIFWGARYVFMENPAPDIMIANMRKVKPTIFISIPKKWYQIYEKIASEINIIEASNDEIQQVVKKLTGGRLKWGLSAAGYLDVEVFQFFQRYGIELMSGFGMTEATGGITMTPPGKYRPDSLGKALPGIELKLGVDGELLIKGPYVMIGYINPEESDAVMVDGWLPTGDIMQLEDGYVKIIDRKKEIYKNIKGETIAPQKIENYFRDFDFIKHVFLVGDNKPFNTLLIYPNYDFKDIDFKEMSESDIRSYFSSVIVSVNRFLASYERIVDFSIIERDFDPDKEELTPKGTYKRKTVEKNFSRFIQPMYDRHYNSLSVNKWELRIPNWFLREKGLTPEEIKYKNGHLHLKNGSPGLKIILKTDHVQIGSYIYKIPDKIIEFGRIFTDPVLWLGNDDIVDFTGPKLFSWKRNEAPKEDISYSSATVSSALDKKYFLEWRDLRSKSEISLEGIHGAASLLRKENEEFASVIMDYLGRVLKDKDANNVRYTIEILKRTLDISSLTIQREAFILLLSTGLEPNSGYMIKSFLDISMNFVDSGVIDKICKLGFDDEKMKILFQITRDYCSQGDKRSVKLLRLLSRYGATHPTKYKIIRQFLTSCQLENYEQGIKRASRVARFECREGFREWLGTKKDVAVDIETGEEYR